MTALVAGGVTIKETLGLEQASEHHVKAKRHSGDGRGCSYVLVLPAAKTGSEGELAVSIRRGGYTYGLL